MQKGKCNYFNVHFYLFFDKCCHSYKADFLKNIFLNVNKSHKKTKTISEYFASAPTLSVVLIPKPIGSVKM